MKLFFTLAFLGSFSISHSRLLGPRARAQAYKVGVNSSHHSNVTLPFKIATITLDHSNATGSDHSTAFFPVPTSTFNISTRNRTSSTNSSIGVSKIGAQTESTIERSSTPSTGVLSVSGSAHQTTSATNGLLISTNTTLPSSASSTRISSISHRKSSVGSSSVNSSSTFSSCVSLITSRGSSSTSHAGSAGITSATRSSTTAPPIIVITVSKSGVTSPVTYISTHTSSGSIKPTGAWMCTGPLCDTSGGCIIPLFCASKGGSSSSWGLCCGWNPPADSGAVPPAGGPQPGPPDDPTPTNPTKPTDLTSSTDSTLPSSKGTISKTGTHETTRLSSTGSTARSGSTSSCSIQTKSLCNTSLSLFTPANATTIATSTITLSCSTLTSCSASASASTSLNASSTTSTANSTATQAYLVFPTNGASRSQLNSITDTLTQVLGPDNSDELVLSDTKSIFMGLMNAKTAANLIHKHSAIRSVIPDERIPNKNPAIEKSTPACNPGNSTKLRRREVQYPDVWQDNAGPELSFVSQPRDPYASVLDIEGYVYDVSAGENITVYVLDTGLEGSNPNIGVGGNRWLWPKKSVWRKYSTEPQAENDPDGHGSCVISKISGSKYGVAKLAKIVVLKIMENDLNLDIFLAGIIKQFELIAEDVKKRNLQGKAILNLSMGVTIHDEDIRAAMKTALETLVVELDIVVVVASGNWRTEYENISQWPPLFFADPGLDAMIIVGSVDLEGKRSSFSQGGSLLDISAPGQFNEELGILCSSGTGAPSEEQRREGTSFSTGAVSGLAAYFMALYPDDLQGRGAPAKVKAYIKEHMWSRNGGPPALWNQKSSPLRKTKKSTAANKRQAVADDACPNGELLDSQSASSTTLSSITAASSTASSILSNAASHTHTSSASSTITPTTASHSSSASSTITSATVIATPDPLTCNGPGGTDYLGMGRISFDRNIAIFALNHLCGSDRPTYTSDPSQTSNNITGRAGDRFWFDSSGGFVRSTNEGGSASGWWSKEITSKLQASVQLWLDVAFSYNQKGCKQVQKFSMPSGSDCTDIFSQLVDGCDVDTTTQKNGGVLHLDSLNGCVDYRLWAESA